MVAEPENYSYSTERWRLLVHGRVQGVGYRYFARKTAMSLGIRGWAKNLSDGTVEVVAQGETGDLSSFMARLEQGPPGSDVTQIDRLDTGTHSNSELPGNFQVK